MRYGSSANAAAVMVVGPMGLVFVSIFAPRAAAQRPVCQMAEALIGAVDHHLREWDNQVEIGLNRSLNCSEFLEFVYLSRDRIRQEIEYIRGNFSAEDELFKAQGEEGQSTTWAMSQVSKAASLVSALIHVHGPLAAARHECLSEHLQLLFLMSLRRLKTLLHGELRQLWIIFQGTAELFRQGAGKWLTELVELFEADLRTMESIMVSYVPPEEDPTDASLRPTRPGPPLPKYSARDADGIQLSTVEVLRRNTFEEWDDHKPVLRGLLRHVLVRDTHVADFCAGGGLAAEFLNDTGLVTAYAFDSTANIQLLSKGAVDHIGLHVAPFQLWRNFEIVFCLTADADFGKNTQAWTQALQNIQAHAARGAIVSCGSEELRQQVVETAVRSMPAFQLDEAQSRQLSAASGSSLCIFWRIPSGS